ncbi:hypothetical protein [Streptobacillus moniliformis]|uniref:hypothetical protein n=1 Tax=Streptobacillus moniliformis TaxID=34105 RepID=UPI0007EECAF4|nr:hypothetical protein [Streptobacillus moniliformis]
MLEKLGKILEGLGIMMLFLTAAVDDYQGSTLRFFIIIALWLISSIIIYHIGHFLANLYVVDEEEIWE